MKFLYQYLFLSSLMFYSLSASEVYLDELNLKNMTTSWGEVQKNKSISKSTLKINGQSFKRGVGTHADSVLNIKLNGATRFKSFVGLDESQLGHHGSVEFKILGDGQELFSSGLMKADTKAKEVDLDLTAYKTLELRVSSGGDGISNDHANWANTRFEYEGKAPETLPFFWPVSSLKEKHVLQSPNQDLGFELLLDENGLLSYQVSRSGQILLPAAPLGFQLNLKNYGQEVSVKLLENYKINESYHWHGVHNPAINHCYGYKYEVFTKDNLASFILDVRVFDDGVAFKYQANIAGSLTMSKDYTGFAFPLGTKLWATLGNEERHIIRRKVAKGHKTFPANPFFPLTAQLPDNSYVALMESNRVTGAIRTVKDLGSGQFRVRLEGHNRQKDKFESSWRVIKIAKDLNALINNDMVHNLAEAPDKKLFPKAAQTSWIQSGKVAWSWMCSGGAKGVNVPNQKIFVDSAAKMKYDYVLVDEGWRHWELNGQNTCGVINCKKTHGDDAWLAMKGLIEYAKSKGVDIWVWKAFDDRRNIEGIKDPVKRREFFKRCKDLGVRGIKLDFFPAPNQEVVQWQLGALKDAAEMQLMVNFHGCAIPAGEARTWPNEMTREAIYGLENGGRGYINQVTLLPYNRFLAGHADFTPVYLTKGGASVVSHLATVALFESPGVHFCEHPENIYKLGPEVSKLFIDIPETWDETIVLPQSKIGEFVAYARRKGNDWYLAAVASKDTNLSVSLDFLKAATNYKMTELREGKDPLRDVKVNKKEVSSSSSINVTIKRGHAYLAQIVQ